MSDMQLVDQNKAATAPKPALAAHLSGLGPKTCATACSPEKGCAITGDMCGHPYQSGLQAVHKMKPDVLRRHAEALEHLEHQAVARRSDRRRLEENAA